jgi:hypothetical protein
MIFTGAGKHCRPRVSAAFLAVLVLLTSGCHKATGGGWIPSIEFIGGKANFGFSVMCKTTRQNGKPVAELYDGQLEWNDGPIRFHGRVQPIFLDQPSCDDFPDPAPSLMFTGVYEPQDGGDPGTFVATVVDGGKGNMAGDEITIELFDGKHHGYFSAGVVQGGSIQVF